VRKEQHDGVSSLRRSKRPSGRISGSSSRPSCRLIASGDAEEEGDAGWEFSKQFQRKLAARGWLVPQWPKEYGGADMGIVEQLILQEEMAYRGAPIPGTSGIRMLGPVLMLYGTEEQKREHLPGIASGEVIWCQGYSEPGSGSDLASLQTRAVRDGDEYVINGQKIWTSNAHRADQIFLLARTDPDAPKHRGISFFVFPMKTPGITVQPLINLAGIHGFNQTFYDNVRVPAKSLVGEENRGWYVGAALLDFERSNISGAAMAKRSLEQLTQYCRETKSDGGSLMSQPLVRNSLAALAVETEVGRLLSYRVASIQAAGARYPTKKPRWPSSTTPNWRNAWPGQAFGSWGCMARCGPSRHAGRGCAVSSRCAT